MRKGFALLLTLCLVSAFLGIVHAQTAVERPKLNVAILIFDGVQIIDYTEPYEVFGAARLNVYTVSEKSDPITTAMGMTVVPKYDFANNPKPDILLIPGGGIGTQLDNPKLIKWIQDNAKDARFVLSVCNGAFFLARAGLLDGLEATTTANLVDSLRVAAPKTRVITNKRVVDNGKIITSGGLSAGIEGALHVVSRIYGEGTAQAVALAIEYHWDRNSTFLPATLARRYLQQTRAFLYPLNAIPLSSTGKENQWEEVMTLNTDLSAEDLLKQLNNSLASEAGWTRKDSATAKDARTSLWGFRDENKRPWNGVANVRNDVNDKNKLIVTVKIARQG